VARIVVARLRTRERATTREAGRPPQIHGSGSAPVSGGPDPIGASTDGRMRQYLVEAIEGDLIVPARPECRGRRRLLHHRGRQATDGAVVAMATQRRATATAFDPTAIGDEGNQAW
jgi:hypothetical protein